MKKAVFIFISALLLLSCDKDDIDFARFNLHQTYWEGTLTYKIDGKAYNYEINIAFESDNIGDYLIEKFTPQLPYSSRSSFLFEKEDKNIIISKGYNSLLTGNWWVVDFQKNKLILRRNVVDNANASELHLTKII